MAEGTKELGSYYTPEILAEFLAKHIFQNYPIEKKTLKILEPSCGNGKLIFPLFSNKLIDHYKKVQLDLIEIDSSELNESRLIVETYNGGNISCFTSQQDYLEYEGGQYDYVISNPPYINKKYLTKPQIENCKAICEKFIPDFGEVKNIWPSFLLKGIDQLNIGGTACFILPSELLQVKYTQKVREFITSQFEHIEIFSFGELIFPKIEQDVVVFIGIGKKRNVKSTVSFYQVDKLEDLKIPDFVQKHSNIHRKRLDKWTNYILDDEELNFIELLVNKIEAKPVETYCRTIEVGIVTAANKYFIVSNKRLSKYKLEQYAEPILQKSGLIPKSLMFRRADFEKADESDKPLFLLNFPKDESELSIEAKRYIGIGERARLNQRYKMKKRYPWYCVPMQDAPDGFFLKRCHLFPRIIVNSSHSLVTDSFYRIKTKENVEMKKLAFCFYNTLTFILSELEGRFYGGGVLELIPSEFKKLSVPYKQNINQSHFKKLDQLIKKGDLQSLLAYTDEVVLGLNESERIRLSNIYQTLVSRRLKSNQPTRISKETVV